MRKPQETKRFQLGKKGLTDEFMSQITTNFKVHRKVKIDILKSACRDKAEAKEIADKIVGTLGKNYDYKLIGYVLTIMKFNRDVRV